ncbi:MAG: thioredoxin fold domain-containing protein [Desulfuromonadaceae bacterium]|nr:thioredoxin fold domain-containing protein [Desulfuromonadaceae bacterium]
MKKAIVLLLFVVVAAAYKTADANSLDLSKAITIGNGPKTVVEYTDPDCPFCRKASKYFEGRSDITRHVFFYPLPSHHRSKEKARYVLSQRDKANAYHMIMSGSLDKKTGLKATTAGIRLQEEQLEIARKNKIDATPTFVINGRIIEGFDPVKIEDALGR